MPKAWNGDLSTHKTTGHLQHQADPGRERDGVPWGLHSERRLVTEGSGAARGPRVVRGAALGRLPGPGHRRLGWGLLLGLADAGAEGSGAGLAAVEAALAAAGRLAGELLVVDDVDAMAAAVDEVLGPGEGQNLLELLVRTAPATGTGLVLTAPLSMAGARWASRIGLRLVLGAPQPAQASVAGLPRGVVTGSAPGRGVVIDGAVEAERALSVQVVTPCAPREATARSAHRLVAIPRTVAPLAGTWAVGGDDARPLPVPRGCVLVVGPPGSGRTTALAALKRCLHENPDEPVLAIDDLDLAEAVVLSRVERALHSGRIVLASATTERVVGTYRGPLATLRERGDLVVLWPALGPASQVAGRSLRAVTDPRAPTHPGRGVLVSRGDTVPIQIAADATAAAT